MSDIEKNIISEADLEKAAGGLKMSPGTLKKGLISLGILTAGAGLGVGGYIVTNKVISYKKGAASTPGESQPIVDAPAAEGGEAK